jgi:hypothetical protein
MMPEHQLSKAKVNMTSFWQLMVMGSGNFFSVFVVVGLVASYEHVEFL